MTASSGALSGPISQPAARPAGGAVAVAIRPARLDDIGLILALHREAFADKFGGAFGAGATERGVAALAAAWRRQGPPALRGMFVAEHEGRVVGTTTVRTWEMSGDDGGAAEIAFHEELGLWGAARSLFALSLLDHRIERREGFVTDVAVLAPYRRGGVARALLARAEQEAMLRGKRFLGLYVSARNEGARSLYSGLGFRNVRVRRSLLAWLIFGQGRWVYMRKDLA
ncbi:MAG TPA: GNAT family N-acetyltransferase [Chloroflexaceae bacterium]|nr:GNAT family N-acetyltransferase [Chloroflexaceae bacterium]